jgi:hypothetical protein
MPVPYTFGTATSAIPLSQLDSNFATAITLGNTAVYLGNTTTSIGNLTLTNVTISSGEVTTGNASVSGNVTLTGGTANGVAYLNTSKVLTTGSALVFNGSNFALGVSPSTNSANTSIEINKAGNGLSVFSNTDFRMSRNVYDDGAKYARSSETAVTYRLGNGTFEWYNAPTGTAGAAISFTQAMTLDASSRLLVGTTSPSPGYTNTNTGAQISASGSMFSRAATDYVIAVNQNTSDGGTYYQIVFRNTNGAIGAITSTSTVCSYTSLSDYRLKNTIAPMTGALAKVALLKPCTYKWNADGSNGEGFIAHELAEVVPYAVTGKKDAVDSDGNPKYQGIDTSFLVATLTAAIQELNAKFEEYKAAHP